MEILLYLIKIIELPDYKKSDIKIDCNNNGRIVVNMHIFEKDENGVIISKKLNPDYLEFEKEYTQLLDKEIEVEYPEITKEDLVNAGKTKDNYIVLFRLIKNKEVK